MNSSTKYQPCKGTDRGPLFTTMTAASLWVIQQADVTEWFVELVREPIVPAEAEVSWSSTHTHLSGANDEA
jgi:hypothetical protein